MEFRIKIKILSISSVETGVPEEKTLQAKLQTTETNRDQCHKNSHGCKLQIFVISQNVGSSQGFPGQYGFACKAEAYTCETLFTCSTLGLAHGLAHKQQTRLEKLDTLAYYENLLLTIVKFL